MSNLPYTLYRAADVRELDRTAIEEFKVPGIELMNRAGNATYEALIARYPDAQRIVVCCGGGNNGGDGFVIARLAYEDNRDVTIMSGIDVEQLKGDAKRAWGAVRAMGLTLTPFDPSRLSHADVIVDAIFGTGLDRDVTGEWAAVIETINNADVPVVAVDIPSGLHADTGEVLGTAIKADLTMTFIGLKQGLFTGEAPEYVGELLFDDLHIPAEVYEHVLTGTERVSWDRLKALLPRRSRDAHKGVYGHVLAIGGNRGMGGAVRMAAEAAARTGAGLTSAAIHPDYVAAMSAVRPEVMWHGVATAADLRQAMARATVIAIGPGLGQDAWAQEMFATALDSKLPLVVDADALNLLAHEPQARGNWIITPHPGEAGRLLGCSSAEINHNRFQSASQLAEKYQAVTVVKGAGSLIATVEGEVALCTDGNPGMATGGMGDVLTGMIAAMVAQGLALEDAAKAGVALHAAAGDRAAEFGERGLMAGDVIAAIRGVVN